MNAQIATTLIAVTLCFSSTVSQARWMRPNTGRFITMDTYEGDRTQPQSLHKYNYAESDPINHSDPTGLTIWVCTRRTVGFPFPLRGFGRHAYLWDDRPTAPRPSVSMQEPYHWNPAAPGSTSERSEAGPIRANWFNAPGFRYVDTSKDIEGYAITGTEQREDEIMTRAHEIANAQIFDPPYWDCHTAIDRILRDMNLPKTPHRKYNNSGERAAVFGYGVFRHFLASILLPAAAAAVVNLDGI